MITPKEAEKAIPDRIKELASKISTRIDEILSDVIVTLIHGQSIHIDLWKDVVTDTLSSRGRVFYCDIEKEIVDYIKAEYEKAGWVVTVSTEKKGKGVETFYMLMFSVKKEGK